MILGEPRAKRAQDNYPCRCCDRGSPARFGLHDPWSHPSLRVLARAGEKLSDRQLLYETFPPRRSPLCLSDSGCAAIGPLW